VWLPEARHSCWTSRIGLAPALVDVIFERINHPPRTCSISSRCRTWEGMIAVGDAFMRIGQAAGMIGGARMTARDAHVTGLIRARRYRSVDGALWSAEGLPGTRDATYLGALFSTRQGPNGSSLSGA
jgi:hypothetical protein